MILWIAKVKGSELAFRDIQAALYETRKEAEEEAAWLLVDTGKEYVAQAIEIIESKGE